MLKKKKGFTLVELLIVIVVIGVLSAMMMLSSTEAVSSAKAANIVNNLHNWKTATLEWYMDHLDKISANGQFLNDNGTVKGDFCQNVSALEISKYLNGEFTEKDANKSYSYGGTAVKDSSGLVYFTDHLDMGGSPKKLKWLIGCYFNNDAKVKEKLEARAVVANLIQKKTTKTYYKADGTDNHLVFIEVMDFSK